MAVILIIEDHPLLGEAVAERVRSAGHQAVLVPSGEQAVAYLEAGRPHSPDLILLDQGLPGMSGLDVLRRIRAEPHTRHLRVVMVSSTFDPKVADQARRLGAEEFLHKSDHFDRRLSRLLNFDGVQGGGAEPGPKPPAGGAGR